jgi:hypothetical protein
MSTARLMLLQVVRLEDPQACEPVCQALRERFPGSIISLPAHYHVARVGHVSAVDQVILMEPALWKAAGELRARRFDAACIAYECPSLPGPLRLEALALLSRSGRLLAYVDGRLREVSSARLALRIACGLGIAALCAILGTAVSLLLPPLLLSRLRPTAMVKGHEQ